MKHSTQPPLYFALSLVLLCAVLLKLLTPNASAMNNMSVHTQTFLPVIHQDAYPAPFVKRLYGVLQPASQHLSADWQAGIRARTLELGWDYYEPQDGTWDAGYIASRKAEYQAMRDAGFVVVLDLGLQYPPEWARTIRPWVDQYGNIYANQVNAIWSSTVRQKIETYIKRVFQDFGTRFYGVRLGSGSFVETLYPDNRPGFQFSYWAFDADAMASNPVPNWRPGQASPNGEAQTFFTWYLQHLIDTVNWQQDVVRQSFDGYIIQLMPGQGLRPNQWNALIASNLMPNGLNIYAAERGAVWDKIIDGMHNRSNVIITCSSLGDSSATDSHVDELSSDPIKWSSAHWVAYNADRYGMPKWAENTGHNDVANMQIVVKQLNDFGYQALFWAFEPDLHSGQYATLDQYAGVIAKNQ
jgi:hypothetical protein